MTLSLRPASPADLDLLAGMNKRLIEDEGSRNPMTLVALKERMASWLGTDEYTVDLFLSGTYVVGYAVYQPRNTNASTGQHYVYLRQLYIARDVRGKGLGTKLCVCLGIPAFRSATLCSSRCWRATRARRSFTSARVSSPTPRRWCGSRMTPEMRN
jgi:L-amino acid N-acyltransferase YncA